MKLTKRLMVTLLVGCMMMTMSLPAFAAAPAEDESDICAQEDEMVTFEAYSAAIEAVYAEYGLEGGVYEPDDFSCTKAQLAEDILAVRAHAEQIVARETAPPAQITIDCEGTVATRPQASAQVHTLPVPQFSPEAGRDCGPATVKQTLTYLEQYAPSQRVIAKSIGTTTAGSTLSSMVAYINKNAGYQYTIFRNPTQGDMQELIAYCIQTMLVPPIGRLAFSKGGNWPYATSGHYLNITGYNTRTQEVQVTDPNVTSVIDGHSGSYWVDLPELHTATRDHFAKEFAC